MNNWTELNSVTLSKCADFHEGLGVDLMHLSGSFKDSIGLKPLPHKALNKGEGG